MLNKNGGTMKRITILALLTYSFTANSAEYKDDEKVSTMNGQLVEVGDRNLYHYETPKFNISVNPFGLVTGDLSVSSSFAITKINNIRAEISYLEEEGAFEYSLGTQVFFKKLYSGIYLEPGLLRREIDNVFGPQVLLGYFWYWDSGMNVSIAAGVGRDLNYKKSEETQNLDEDRVETFGNAYFKVGYAF